ncbi:hypothetical protein CN074_32535, partial [Sinorhizobium medicae]|uniref:hypothetical protein n=1 Tax=Sinorhizobium medicae TaxID=110321 RepID=UPI000FE07C92
MKEDSVIFIGLHTSKLKISVAIADGSRNGRSCPGRWCRSRLMAVLSDIEPEGYQRATAGRL